MLSRKFRTAKIFQKNHFLYLLKHNFSIYNSNVADFQRLSMQMVKEINLDGNLIERKKKEFEELRKLQMEYFRKESDSKIVLRFFRVKFPIKKRNSIQWDSTKK